MEPAPFCRPRAKRDCSSRARLQDLKSTRRAFRSPIHRAIGCARGPACRATSFTMRSQLRFFLWGFAIRGAARAATPLLAGSARRFGDHAFSPTCPTFVLPCSWDPTRRRPPWGPARWKTVSAITETIYRITFRYLIHPGDHKFGSSEIAGSNPMFFPLSNAP